jgi:hypothetical protein
MLVQELKPQLIRPPVAVCRAAAGSIVKWAFGFGGHGLFSCVDGFEVLVVRHALAIASRDVVAASSPQPWAWSSVNQPERPCVKTL